MRADKKRKVLFKWGLSTLTIAIVSAVSLLTLPGCSQNPNNEQAFDYTGALDFLQNAEAAHVSSTGATDPSLVSGTGDPCVSQTVGPGGGSLTLTVGTDTITFNVPPNALDSDVVITICGWTDVQPEGEVFVYDCQPSGLQFKIPMWVRHPVSVDGVENSALFYKGDASVSWSFETVEGVTSNTAVFEIHHFSGYGVSNFRVGL